MKTAVNLIIKNTARTHARTHTHTHISASMHMHVHVVNTYKHRHTHIPAPGLDPAVPRQPEVLPGRFAALSHVVVPAPSVHPSGRPLCLHQGSAFLRG